MKSHCSTAVGLERSVPDVTSNANTGQSSSRYCFHRISQAIERGILAFVVLATLLGTYVNHSILMGDILIF